MKITITYKNYERKEFDFDISEYFVNLDPNNNTLCLHEKGGTGKSPFFILNIKEIIHYQIK